jgi:hypothetical protein
MEALVGSLPVFRNSSVQNLSIVNGIEPENFT